MRRRSFLRKSNSGYEYIEIGGRKWAKKNIGATSITDTGLYFAWGETQGYTADQIGVDKVFEWVDYKFNPSGDGSTFTKYSGDGQTVLEAEDDAATVNMGSDWRMPTVEDYDALKLAVNLEWTDNYQGSGVSGMVLTSISEPSKKLFFPAAGYGGYGSLDMKNEQGSYWSSSVAIDGISFSHAHDLNFYRDENTEEGYTIDWAYDDERCIGLPIRAIYDPQEPPSKDYVEIGGIKWGKKNLGAENVTDYGLYFQWGDISGYTASQVGSDKIFDYNNYIYYDASYPNGMKKYNTTDQKSTLDDSDDAATEILGSDWRMPTLEEFNTLIASVDTHITWNYQDSGIGGIVCNDKEDASKELFFPFAGYAYDRTMQSVNQYGDYWSKSIDSLGYQYGLAWALEAGDGSIHKSSIADHSGRNRIYGLTIRPIYIGND